MIYCSQIGKLANSKTLKIASKKKNFKKLKFYA